MTNASDKPLRVLFLTRKWPPAVGGMETYSHELSRDLAGLVDLEVRALQGGADGHPPPLGRLLLFLITSAWRLWRRRHEYDVVHYGDLVLFPLAWWHALWAPAKARVISVHGLDLIYGNRRGPRPAIYRRYLAWARKRRRAVDRFIANSRNTARLAAGLGFDPVTVVPLGVRLPPADQARPEKPDPPEPYVLFIGRLVRRKGARWFAESVLPLLPPELSFYVAGTVWDAEEAAALRHNPRVRLLGFVAEADLDRLRQGAAAVVMPNVPSERDEDVEGFGLVALEAAARRAVVLASDLEGISDAVRDGETGYLIPTGDAVRWAERIREILQWQDSERRAFYARARAGLERHYSWTRVADDTVCVYRQALAGAGEAARLETDVRANADRP